MVRRGINEGRGNDRPATDTTPGAPATRPLSLGSNGGMTGLMTTAVTAATRGHQEENLRTLRGRAHLNTDTSDVASVPRFCVRGGLDHYAHVLNQHTLLVVG